MKTQPQPSDGGTRAYPLAEAFNRLGIGRTKGSALIKSGELQSFCIGRFRYVSQDELSRFVQARIAASLKEKPADRARKVRKAVEARSRQRAGAAA